MKVKVVVYECTCERCTHKWTSRVGDPKRCPKCKTPYWNRPRKLKKDEESKEVFPMPLEVAS